MMAIRLRSVPDEHQRQQRADAGRRQRRENRDRVDVALVEHAEHDVHRDDRREDQQQRAVERGAERLRRALEARLDAGRHADLALRGFDGRHRLAERRAGAEVERERHGGELAGVVDDQARVRAPRSGRCCASGTCWTPSAARSVGDVDLAERLGPDLIARRRFEHDAILVRLRVDRRDQPLAERVVERIVDGRDADAETAGGVAIDVDEGLQAAILQVAGDVGELRAPASADRSASAPTRSAVPRSDPRG